MMKEGEKLESGVRTGRLREITRNVQPTPHRESLLREYLARGGYHTPEDVIEHALEILSETEAGPEPCTIIVELQGLGKEIWLGIDAQAYVNQQRAAGNGERPFAVTWWVWTRTLLSIFIEENPAYMPLVRPFFEPADRGEFQIVTSILTLTEVLVNPLRRGDPRLADQYRRILLRARQVTTVAVSEEIEDYYLQL